MTSFNITSEEHLEFIAVKEGKKATGSGKAVGLAVRPIEEVQQDLLKQKEVAGGKSKTKARSAPKQKSASRKNCQEAETVCRQLWALIVCTAKKRTACAKFVSSGLIMNVLELMITCLTLSAKFVIDVLYRFHQLDVV